MSLLSFHSVSYSHILGTSLLKDVTFSVDSGDRIGLAGPNGSGKTTLLRLMAGDIDPLAGSIIRRKHLRLEMLERPSEHDLSSGERTREAIARLMRNPADLVLLDEPTNHLDKEGRKWLAEWLIRQRVTCVIVSHDRAFLNEVTTRTLSIERGQVRGYAGNYDFALTEKESKQSHEWQQYDSQQRRIAAAERAAEKRDRLSAKVAKAPPGVRHSKDFYARKAAKVARTGRLLRERDKIEPTIAKPWEEQGISELDFSSVPYCSELVIQADGLSVAYGEAMPVVDNLSFHVYRGEHWAIEGPNGSGKTTLLRALLGDLKPAHGRIHWGAGVRIGYYAQEHEHLDPGRTPLDAVMDIGADETSARTFLACLKVGADLVRKPIGTLSLGERSKTVLARLLLGRHNVLLLDEPTNHLEMEAQTALSRALEAFPGAVLFVSHDRWFTDELSTNRLDLQPSAVHAH